MRRCSRSRVHDFVLNLDPYTVSSDGAGEHTTTQLRSRLDKHLFWNCELYMVMTLWSKLFVRCSDTISILLLVVLACGRAMRFPVLWRVNLQRLALLPATFTSWVRLKTRGCTCMDSIWTSRQQAPHNRPSQKWNSVPFFSNLKIVKSFYSPFPAWGTRNIDSSVGRTRSPSRICRLIWLRINLCSWLRASGCWATRDRRSSRTCKAVESCGIHGTPMMAEGHPKVWSCLIHVIPFPCVLWVLCICREKRPAVGPHQGTVPRHPSRVVWAWMTMKALFGDGYGWVVTLMLKYDLPLPTPLAIGCSARGWQRQAQGKDTSC